MRLTALVDRPDHVCCRYRLAALRPYLQQNGHTLELRALPQRWWQWFRLGSELCEADAVILQRKLLQAWQLSLLRRAARRLIFDFDDAVFLRDSYASRGLQSARRLRRFAAVVRASDHVFAGNAFLADYANSLAPGRVRIIPTSVEPAHYPQANHRDRGRVQLVWIGSSSTLQGMQAIQPILEDLGRQFPRLQLKLICDRFLELTHLAVLPCRWSEAREAEELAAADIGISWIPDDAWSRGKCGLKVLQYMAAGLPVIANPVGVQREMVRHGENGFLATTASEWYEAVARMIDDPGLRRRMGAAGRQRVEREYSVARAAAVWTQMLEQGLRRTA